VFQHDELRRQAAQEARRLWRLVNRREPIAAEDAPDFDASPTAQTLAASTIHPARWEWLWPGRIPLGTLTLFSGDPKLGKSLAALSLIAALSRGGPLPGGDGDAPVVAPCGSALLLSAEDDPARTIVPRLIAAGADLDRVHLLAAMRDPDFGGYAGGASGYVPAGERMPTLSPDDLRGIERRALALGDCRLIVFDPVSAYVGGPGLDVRRVLTPLRQIAERLEAAVLLITHHNKWGGSGTSGKHRVMGSISYVGVCRADFLFLADPDDPTGRRRLMLDNGGNLAAGQPGLVYVIQGKDDDAYVEWLPETIDLDADAALARAATAGKIGATGKTARRRECEGWLRGHLAGGPKPAKECEQAALEGGFTRSVVAAARVALAVRCVRSGFGKGACYLWSLPEAEGESPERSDVGGEAHAAALSPMRTVSDT
jgi:hypothetical protein